MARRVGAGIAALIGAAVVLLVVAILVLTNTAWGHLQVRQLALRVLQGPVHGIVRIASIQGDLLDHLVVTDLSITDSSGAPLVSARRAAVRYRLADLVRKRLAFTDVRLDAPVVVLAESQDSVWNYRRVFPPSPGPASSTPGFGSYVTLANVQIIDGDLTVRTPWRPDPGLHGAARDSAIAAATSPSSRPSVQAIPGGFEKIVAVHALTATAPTVRLADPAHPTKVIRFAALRADLAAFRPPDAVVRDLAGTFYLDTAALWWRQADLHLPASHISGRGTYQLASGNLDLALLADSAALGDLRFLDPVLPDSGGLRGQISVRWLGPQQTYTVRDLVLQTGRAHLSGQLGVSLGDTVAFQGTDLHFAGVDTRLIERLAPRVAFPRSGTVGGHAVLAGPMSALTVNADVTYDDSAAGPSRVMARGELGVGQGFEARHLAITLTPLQLAVVMPPASTSPIGGTISGRATLDGSTTSIMSAQANLVQRDGAALTHIVAAGDVAFVPPGTSQARDEARSVPLGSSGAAARDSAQASTRPRPRHVDLTARLEPLDLAEVGKLLPAAQLYGRAGGGLRISGDMRDLVVHARLGVVGAPDSSGLTVDGHIDLADTMPTYDVVVGTHLFDAREVSHAAPPTSLTAAFTVTGRGTQPATMATTMTAHIRASEIDSVTVDTLLLHARVQDGRLAIDTAHVRALGTTADIDGSFGLVAGQSGTLTYRVAIDSLQAWQRFLPRDTTAVPMRGEALAAAVARARADSARRADSTEMERAIRGTPPPRLVVDTPHAIRRDTLAGRVAARGTVRGNRYRFDVQGALAADSVVAMGNAARRAHLLYQWTGAPDRTAPLAATVRLDTVTAAGFAFDSIDARVTFHQPDGTVRLVVLQDTMRGYALNALFRYTPVDKELRYDTLSFRFDTTVWRAPRPASISWDTGGLAVHDVELRDGRTGRIIIDGRLARADTGGHLSVLLQRVNVGDLASMAQMAVPLDGELSLRAALDGSLQNPAIRGTASLSDASVRTVPLPNVFAQYDYDTAALVTRVELAPKGAPSVPFARLDATVPIDLASNASGSRLLNRPLVGELQLDSLPLEDVAEFESSVTGVTGRVRGHITLGGTPRNPLPRGALTLANGAAVVTATGMSIDSAAGTIQLTRDSIVIDSLVARTPSTRGRMRLAATLDRTDSAVPVVTATLSASNLRVLDTRERGRLDMDGDLTVAGPTQTPYIYGKAGVRDGVYYLEPSNGKDIIDLAQPVVYHVVDTTQPAVRQLLPTSGSLFSRLLMDVDVTISRSTWVRNENGNVEAHTDGPLTLHVDHAHQTLVVNGSIGTDVGEYRFLGKRFTITKGVATFIGAPRLNPTVSATGEYDVPVPGREALAININIGGDIDSLRLSLSSNAEPPISQSDLLSYLAFGNPTSGVAQSSQSSSLTTTSGGGVVGTAGTFVEDQIAAEAVGVVADQLKGNLARALDADVLDITTGNNYTDIAQNRNDAAAVFIQNTQLEFGKYFTPRTYVSFQASVAPGASVVHRVGPGLSVQLSGEPLYLLGLPTLATNPNTPLTGVLGLSLAKSWKF